MLNPLLMDIGNLQETCGGKFSSLEYKWNDFCTFRKKHVQRQRGRLKGMWELEISVGRPDEVETILSSVMFEGKSRAFGPKAAVVNFLRKGL